MRYENPGYTKEAVIQAELYKACIEVGLGCDLQYTVNLNLDRRFLDAVIVEGQEIIAIIEVKNSNTSYRQISNSNRLKGIKDITHQFILYVLNMISQF